LLKKLSNKLAVAIRKIDGEKKEVKRSGNTYMKKLAIFILSNRFEIIVNGCEII
jgi:hypothetical protein